MSTLVLGLTMTLNTNSVNLFAFCLLDGVIHSCLKLIFYDNIMTLSDLAEFVNNNSAKPWPGTTGGGGETGQATVGRFRRSDII